MGQISFGNFFVSTMHYINVTLLTPTVCSEEVTFGIQKVFDLEKQTYCMLKNPSLVKLCN